MISEGAELRVDHTGTTNGKTGAKGWAVTCGAINLLYCDTLDEAQRAYIELKETIALLKEGSK